MKQGSLLSSFLMMEATGSYETSVDFQRLHGLLSLQIEFFETVSESKVQSEWGIHE
jgi:hypothetical protein